MTRNRTANPFASKRIYHSPGLFALDDSGRVSALCYKTPRAIRRPHSWTFDDDAVNCPACLKKMKVTERKIATLVRHGDLDLTIIADPTAAFEEYFKKRTPRRPTGAVVPDIYLPEFCLLTVRRVGGPESRAMIYMDRIPNPNTFRDFRLAMDQHFFAKIRLEMDKHHL